MTEHRLPIDHLLDNIKWHPISDTKTPVATHWGILHIGNVELRVYQLSNGQRVISQEDLLNFFNGRERLTRKEKISEITEWLGDLYTDSKELEGLL